MQISLKQSEIVAALKMYVTQQGINLAGKSVSIDFTAGRKEAGITADIDIEDGAQVPDLGFDDEAATATAAVIKTAAAPALAIVKTEAPAVAAVAVEPPFEGATAVAAAEPAAEAAAPKAGKTVASAGTSLFA